MEKERKKSSGPVLTYCQIGQKNATALPDQKLGVAFPSGASQISLGRRRDGGGKSKGSRLWDPPPQPVYMPCSILCIQKEGINRRKEKDAYVPP